MSCLALNMNRFQIAVLLSILPTILLASPMSAQKASTEFGTATLYRAPVGESPSPQYEIRVIDRKGTARPSFVYSSPVRQVTTPGAPAEHQVGRTFSWTTFETDGPVRVQVVRRNGSFKTLQLRPLRYGLKARTVNQNTIEFVALPGQKISVEFDTAMGKCYWDKVDCVRDILMVFVDPRSATSPVTGFQENDIYRPRPGTYATDAKILNITASRVVSTLGGAGGKKAVVFGPGVYDIGYWEVPNNVEHIHLEGGAIVYGAINVLPLGTPPKVEDYRTPHKLALRPEFKLTGHGVLSGRKIPWHMTRDFGYCLEDCSSAVTMVHLAVANFTITDLTVADSPLYNMTFAEARRTGVMSGFKIVAQWATNTDGVTPPARGRVDNCFIQGNDDLVNLANNGTSVSGCTLWQFGNGAAFQMGWYRKSISGITVSDIDVIHSETWFGPGDNYGLLNYAKADTKVAGSGEIRDISFNNIRLEDKTLRLVGLTPQAGQKISGIRFSNVKVESWRHQGTSPEGRTNYLDGINGGSINGITFEDVTVGGQAVTSANFQTVGRFETNGDVAGVGVSHSGLVSTADFANSLLIYQPSSEVKATPETEPHITALARNLIQTLSSGKPLEGMDDSEAKVTQRTLASFGRLRSLAFVNREVGATRNYTYQLTFKDLVAFFTMDLGAEDKLEGLHIRIQMTPKARQELFKTFWETINKEYFDPKFGGVDWVAVRQRYAPQIAAAKSDEEFSAILGELVQELPKTSHLSIGHAWEPGAVFSSPIIWTGLSFDDMDSEVVITRILKDSPAEKAGLRLGYSIKKIDDDAVENSDDTTRRLSDAKEVRTITFRDDQDVIREVTLRKELPPAHKLESDIVEDSTLYGVLESQRLSGDIGYIYFTSFLPALKNRLLAALDSMQDARGIIIDLRGNYGGASETLGLPMASKLLGKETLLAISRTRKGFNYDYKAKSHKNPYLGLVVMLVDSESASASEAITAGLQEAGRVVVIGKKTSGSVMDAELKRLPAGVTLMYPVGQFRTPKGVVLEGRGVIPDIEVNLTRGELLKGRDSQLEAAVEYIRTHGR